MPKPGYKLANWYFGKYEEIPEEWSMNLMKDLCKVRQGLQIPISERFNESGPNRSTYITVKAVHSGKFEEFIENPGKRVVCTKDDILFTRTGNTGEIITNIEGVFHNNFFLVDFDRKILSKNYLIYFLKQGKIQGFIRGLAGSTTIPDLNHDDFFRLLMPVPPIEEQKKIASILNTVDNLIAKYDSIIDSTKLLKQGLMQTLLTKGIGHKKFKKIKWLFGKEIEIPDEWEMRLLSDLSQVVDSRHFTPKYTEKGIPLILPNNVTQSGLDFSNTKFTTKDDYAELIAGNRKPEKNDIIYTRNASFGVANQVVDNTLFSLGQDLVLIKPTVIEPYLLFRILNSEIILQQLTSLVSGSTFKRINLEFIRSFLIPTSNKQKEQQKIASILSNVDSKISELESKKSHIEKIKKGLMQKLLTGQIRIRV